jgi:hypothetical protein
LRVKSISGPRCMHRRGEWLLGSGVLLFLGSLSDRPGCSLVSHLGSFVWFAGLRRTGKGFATELACLALLLIRAASGFRRDMRASEEGREKRADVDKEPDIGTQTNIKCNRCLLYHQKSPTGTKEKRTGYHQSK